MITSFAIDKIITLDINGSSQQIRMCARSIGLPPILIVQAGPGLPLLNEVNKFQRRLNLETDFTVIYWDQRGCGIASRRDAISVSLRQQVDDLRAVLKWIKNDTRQAVILFGISLGATISLQAAELEPDNVWAVIAISADAHIADSDESALSFLIRQSEIAGNERIRAQLMKLGSPPYIDPALFQRRARMLADLEGIERGRRFGALLRETLSSVIRTYGFLRAIRVMRNMNFVQRNLLPKLASLNLLSNPSRLAIPVYYVFGEQDPLVPSGLVRELPKAISSSKVMVRLVNNAAHMVHFDQPSIVRSIVMSTRYGK